MSGERPLPPTADRLLALQEAERRTLAYDLHDGPVQQMAAALMHLEAALAQPIDCPALRENVERAAALVREAVAESRRMIDGLQPAMLDHEGLLPALEYLVEQARQRAGIAIDWRAAAAAERLSPAQQTALYRIVQEALNNLCRHSQARRAEAELAVQPGRVVLRIEDDGVGFDPTAVPPGHHGLEGVRTRAELLGGRAEIASAPGQGARLLVTLPLEQ